MSPALQPPQKDFFVSYTRTDREWAKWIAWKLEEDGYTVIIQAWDFLSGGNFILEMDEATQRARRTIAVLSPDYLNALYTHPEWAAAFVQDPTGIEGTLMPVRVVPCELKGLLRPIGYIDLVGLDEQEALAKLLQGVKRERAKPSTAPSFPGASSTPASGTASSASPSATPASFPKNPLAATPVETIIINAKEDEAVRKELEKHLRPLELEEQITIWHRDKLEIGEISQQGIDTHFYKAKLILLLISKDFLSSADCHMLMREAMKRSKIREARVVPIIIRSCDWERSLFSTLVTLPRNDKPVDQWGNKDSAYLHIAKEIRNTLPNA